MTYEIKKSVTGKDIIARTNANGSISWIPTDEANIDYQEYLASLEK